MSLEIFLNNLANRLGFQDEAKLIKKAEELTRILNSKVTSNKIKASAEAVLCFDIASSLCGVGIDKDTAIKLSGLTKNQYQNNLNMLQKVLELDKPLSVKEVCVQFSCTVVKELSEAILKSYEERSVINDVAHPQYVAIAVYTACKLKKVKVDKAKFISLSRLKTSQWKELEMEFDSFVEKQGLSNLKSKKSPKNELYEALEEHVNKSDTNKKTTRMEKDGTNEETEDYEIWKARILIAAKEALNNN